jgi:hypothetical protein
MAAIAEPAVVAEKASTVASMEVKREASEPAPMIISNPWEDLKPYPLLATAKPLPDWHRRGREARRRERDDLAYEKRKVEALQAATEERSRPSGDIRAREAERAASAAAKAASSSSSSANKRAAPFDPKRHEVDFNAFFAEERAVGKRTGTPPPAALAKDEVKEEHDIQKWPAIDEATIQAAEAGGCHHGCCKACSS